MTAFWLASAVLILVALAFVLPPLLRAPISATQQRLAALDDARRSGVIDGSEYASKLAALDETSGPSARRPIPWLALSLTVLVPAVSVGLYSRLGDPRVFDPAVQSVEAAMQQAQHAGMAPMDQAIAGLSARLAREPNDLEGWLLLARAQKSTEHFDDATESLAKAMALAPDNASIMVEYAESKTLSSMDKHFDDASLALLDRALSLEPDHQRALWLRGIAHYQRGDVDAASATWNHLLSVLPADSPVRASIEQQLAQLKPNGQASAASETTATEATRDAAATASAPRLRVHVALAPDLADKVQADDVLFVFARAASGPRAPLAIVRRRASELPLTVELDDSQAMVPAMNLSSAAQVVVGARISRSGQAQAESGDLQTYSEPVANHHAETLELTIDTIVP
ncbi:MAG TPA: tetratricopeptide repeat protein [Chiayiivirga sp.]|nr:tetratricopeptide repeat protein [Chiayiivirga sp.]